MSTSSLHSQLKCSCFLSLFIRFSVYQTQASLLGILITFVNTFHFNLVVMFVCFTFCIFINKLDLFKATNSFYHNIVSRFPNETTYFSPQTFIVRFLIISNMKDRHIYTRTERRGNRLAAGETERERVCVCVRGGDWLKIELASVVKTAIEERLTILG